MQYIENLQEEVEKGNIRYDIETLMDKDHINLYLGNGLIAGCIDKHGNMTLKSDTSLSRTALTHKYHYKKDQHGMECLLPLFTQSYRILLNDKEIPFSQLRIVEYSQLLNIFTGTLKTIYSFEAYKDKVVTISVEQWMSQHIRNAFMTSINVECSTCESLLVEVEIDPINPTIDYQYKYNPEILDLDDKENHGIDIRSNAVSTKVFLLPFGKEKVTERPSGLAIGRKFDNSGTLVMAVIAVSEKENIDYSNILQELKSMPYVDHIQKHKKWWHDYWNDSLVSFESTYPLMKIWLRTNYYLAVTEASFQSIPFPPCGLTSNAWAFFFPQDYWYVYQNYLSANHSKQWREPLNTGGIY